MKLTRNKRRDAIAAKRLDYADARRGKIAHTMNRPVFWPATYCGEQLAKPGPEKIKGA